jgi:single-strand DNA-binding protein
MPSIRLFSLLKGARSAPPTKHFDSPLCSWERFRLLSGAPIKNGAEREMKTMYLNSVTLTGFLGRDAESKTLANDSKMTVFSVATKNSWKNQETGEWESKSEWHRCVAFGPIAEVTAVLKSGDHVHVQGQLQTREYVGSKSPDKRRETQIRVSSVLRVELLSRDETSQPDEEARA